MKKPLLLLLLTFLFSLAKAQQADTLIAKLGRLPYPDYQIPPRVNGQFLTAYVSEKIAAPNDLPANSNDYAVIALRIDSNGTLGNVKLIKSFTPAADSVILQALRSLPAIQPARFKGRNVTVDFVVGVRFGKGRWNDERIRAIAFSYTPTQLRDPGNADMVFAAVQTPPSFPGGEKAFGEYLKKNIVYPRNAKVKGTVFITFVIRKDGSLSDLVVLRSPDDALSDAALQVLQNSPLFTPGKQNGKAVDCLYTIPIGFNE